MKLIKNLSTHMIVIDGDEKSEFYADYCILSWEDWGFVVNKFSAHTPQTIQQLSYLKFHKQNLSNKYTVLGLEVPITSTEQACWHSHYALWQKCANMKEPILILEHDAYLQYPEKFWIDTHECGLIFYDKAAMGAYVITPEVAQILVDYWSTHVISTGVFAGIHTCYLNTKWPKPAHAHFTTKLDPCVNQVWSRRFKNTIHHASDDFPHITWKQHEFIWID